MGIAPLPLLHVVQTTARITTVDPRLVVLALLTLGFVSIRTWMPTRMSLHRLAGAPATRATLAILVFFAVLPSVVPYDHLLPGVHHDGAVAEDAIHATHCHLTPGSCADAPIPSGPGQLMFNDPLVIAPSLMAVLLALLVPVLTGVTREPDTRPPVR